MEAKKITIQDTIQGCKDENPNMYLCMFPFFHLFNDSKGMWKLCCDSSAFDHGVNEVGLADHFDHPDMHKVRREMLSGQLATTNKLCAKCLSGEKRDMMTKRKGFNEFILNRMNPEENPLLNYITDYANGEVEGALPNQRILDVKLRIFGNVCNLSCYMCHPSNSSARVQELKKIKNGYWFDHLGEATSFQVFDSTAGYESFVDEVMDLLPFIRSVRIIGGEPFLLKKHYEFLERVIESGHSQGIMLNYQTNLTKFDIGRERTLNYFNQFDSIRMLVSLDGVGDRNDYIRFGGDFNEIMDNIHYLKANARVDMAIDTVISSLNAGNIVEILTYFESDDVDVDVDMNILTGPDFLQARHLPDDIKDIYRKRIMESKYRDRCKDVLNMLDRPWDKKKFEKFLAYIYDLDKARESNLLDFWPEFKAYYTPPSRVSVPVS